MAGIIPTKNPVPSKDIRDLGFNSEKMDEVINSENTTYTDRKGRSHLTIKGLEEAAVSAGPTVDAAIQALEQANLARDAAQQIELNASDYILQAESSAKSAQQSEANSEQSAIRAESAASSVAIEAKVFANISEGIAGTANGEMFKVWSNPNTGISFLFYKNNNGTAELLTNYPSASAVDVVSNEVNNLSSLFSHPNIWSDDDLVTISAQQAIIDKEGISYLFNNVSITKKTRSANPAILVTSKSASVGALVVDYPLSYLSENKIQAGEVFTFGIR
ncbi:hypothetical protein [Providencia sp. PROV144]|uniref:hypothetical protein n=1 Tax=Providencia sp. PROV144 TaxID=2949854 RepID=UPI00234966DF|nr:hypothetical protein [Providencia sp. PROV144]